MRVVILTHTSTRTGAPLLLIKLIKWLRSQIDVEILIINRESNVLDEEFSSLARTLHFNLPFKIRSVRQLRHLPQPILAAFEWITAKYIRFRLRRFLAGNEETVVLSNTVACNDLLHFVTDAIANLRQRVVYVHELTVARSMMREISESRGINFPIGDRFMCCSEAVLRNLANAHPSIAGRLELLPYFFLDPPLAVTNSYSQGRDVSFSLIPELHPEQILVGGIGAPDWRKGFDLFILLAKQFADDERFYFAWLGRVPNTRTDLEYSADVANLKLKNFSWIPYQSSSEEFLRRCDVFALTSREDPFPLVNLEAMAMACPIVCFDAGGGAAEIVSRGAGTVVPYGDLQAFKSGIAMYADPNRNKETGSRGLILAREYFSDAESGHKLLEMLGVMSEKIIKS